MSFSQESNSKIYNEIINQVWKPFKKSYDTKDFKTFNNLHTDDVIRINAWSIRQGDIYKKVIEKNYQTKTDIKSTIDFWIEQSVLSETISHQIGYYAVTYKESNKKDKIIYAQFQVTLKKVNGTWKIWQDFDTEWVGGKKVNASFLKSLEKLKL